MKTWEMFALCVVFLDTFLIASSSPCLQQNLKSVYQVGDILSQYEKEVGIRNYLTNFFTGSSSKFKIPLEAKEALCACILSKMKSNTYTYDEALRNISAQDHTVSIQLKYYNIIPYSRKTPCLYCVYKLGEVDEFVIVKGYMRKGAGVYDLYFAPYSATSKVNTFWGVIEAVDVEASPKNEIP